jgi:hypothetical protein
MADKGLSLYEMVKQLQKLESKMGKKDFWAWVRGLTGQRYTRIEKISPRDLPYVLHELRERFGEKG